MKILWLSNRVISFDDVGVTGTWLIALASALKNIPDVELGNITNSPVNKIQFQIVDSISQWLIPTSEIKQNGLPNKRIRKAIIEIIHIFNPDVIHVWGTESYWGVVTSVINKDYPILVEIQGLIKEIARYYTGGLTLNEMFKCIGLKEIIRRKTIFDQVSFFKHWGREEEKVIKSHFFFSTHSNWAEFKVRELNSECTMYKNERILRPEFYYAEPWRLNNSAVLFTSMGDVRPYKGLHVLIRALDLLKREYPEIKLYIAGPARLKGIRRDGYLNFVNNIIKRSNLIDNIIWVGSVSAKDIIGYLKETSVCVFPSFLESYGVALAESMMIGVPSVAAYNGGYSYLGSDNVDTLFFPPGDSSLCAFQIKRILTDGNLAQRLSRNSRFKAKQRNDYNNIINKQIQIYHEISQNNIT